MTICSAVAGAAAILLILFAWRGRRVDDHPVCRRCKFDLFGLPETSTRCPECGADLSRPRARRIGNREICRGWRTAGLLLAGLAAPVWVLAGVVWLRGLDTIRYHPVWMLRNDARSADVAASDRAYTELLRRLAAGRLTAGDLSPIVNDTLDLQADATKPWRPVMGDLVEQAWLANRLGNEQWTRYVTQVLQTWIDFRFRERASRSGGTIAYEFVSLPRRAGSTQRLTPRLDVQIDFDWPNITSSPGRARPSFTPGLQFRTYSYGTAPALHTMKLGPHTARATLRGHVSAANAPPNRAVDVEFHVDRPWTLVDGPAAAPLNDPSMEEAIRRCVSVSFPGRFPRISITSPPCPVAWDVLFTAPGAATAPTTRRRGPLAPRQVTCDVGETTSVTVPLFSTDVPDDARTVTVTLSPSQAAAESSTRLNSYWNGTLVFKDVPVPPRPGTRPTTRPRTSIPAR